ncbi:MAG: hypothetical protein ACTHJV_03390 [Rhizobiaceae bacterium]
MFSCIDNLVLDALTLLIADYPYVGLISCHPRDLGEESRHELQAQFVSAGGSQIAMAALERDPA